LKVFGLVAQEAESPPFFLDAEGGLAYLLDAGRRRMFSGPKCTHGLQRDFSIVSDELSFHAFFTLCEEW
jgi:hypothetical protein